MTIDRQVTIDAETLTRLAVSYADRLGFDPAPDQLATLERVHDLLQAVDPSFAWKVASHSGALAQSRYDVVPSDSVPGKHLRAVPSTES